MGRRAFERAQHFSWDQISRRVLSYYERLAYGKQGGNTQLPEDEDDGGGAV